MTPYEYAEALRKEFEDFAHNCQPAVTIPEMSYSKLGEQVIACESLIFAVTDISAQPLFENGMVCGFIQVGTIVVTLARECSYEMRDDGSEDVDQVTAIAVQLDRDSDCLWDWAQRVEPFIVKDFSIGFVNTGGLAITSLTLTVGVP